ncbi:MAG: hypothetical protein ACR2MM_08235 [Flavobacteriaceae bacterium]
MGPCSKKFLLSLCFVVGAGSFYSNAQQSFREASDKKIKVKKHTVLAQYEPELVLPAEERLQLKTDRQATIIERRQIIDTLDISDRKRRRLLKELYRSPFSYKWDKVIADIQAEEDQEE